MKAKSVVDVILGEAAHGSKEQRYEDMLAIASVISNRARLSGRPMNDVVSHRGEFNAFGKPLPAGAGSYRTLAEKALKEIEANGPVHGATYYATPRAARNLPSGLERVGQTTGHVYYTDPQMRPFRTGSGWARPNPVNLITNPPVPTPRPDPMTTSSVEPLSYAQAQQSPRGLQAVADVTKSGPPIRVGDITFAYEMGPRRPNPPDQSVLDVIGRSVQQVLGPEATVVVTSGQEGRLPSFGSNRHKTGRAADVQIFDQTGRQMTYATDADTMVEIARQAANHGAKGIGWGERYMGGQSMHIDLVDPGPEQAHTWGDGPKGGEAFRDEITGAIRNFQENDFSNIAPLPSPAPREDMVALQRLEDRAQPIERAPLAAPADARKAEEASMAALAQMNAEQQAAPVQPARPENPDWAASVEAALAQQPEMPAAPQPDPNAALMPPVPQPRPQMAPPLPPPTTIPDRAPIAQFEDPVPQAPSMPSGMHAISSLFGEPEGAMAVSRSNPDISFASLGNGMVERQNQYGYTQTLRPGDYSHPTTPGPTTGPKATDPNAALTKGGLSSKKKDGRKDLPSGAKIAGAIAGAALGTALAGPVGGMLGSRLGASIGQRGLGGAVGHTRNNLINSPLGRLFSGPFPDAPAAPADANRGGSSGPSYDDMRSISPDAADAISSGKAGLF